MKYHTWEIRPSNYSNRIDEHHNGFINFRNQPEPGVTSLVYMISAKDERKPLFIINNDFWMIYLLFEEYINHPTTNYVQTTDTFRGKRVLWVEDNIVKANINYIKEFLGITGLNLLLYYDTMIWMDKTYNEWGIRAEMNIPADCEDVAFLFSNLSGTGLGDTKKTGRGSKGNLLFVMSR